MFWPPIFWRGERPPPEFLHLHHKIEPVSDRVAKFHRRTAEGARSLRVEKRLIACCCRTNRDTKVVHRTYVGVFEIMGPKHIRSWPWLVKVTWRHQSHDHSIRHMLFPIGRPLVPILYREPFSRYSPPKLVQQRQRHRSKTVHPPSSTLFTWRYNRNTGFL